MATEVVPKGVDMVEQGTTQGRGCRLWEVLEDQRGYVIRAVVNLGVGHIEDTTIGLSHRIGILDKCEYVTFLLLEMCDNISAIIVVNTMLRTL